MGACCHCSSSQQEYERQEEEKAIVIEERRKKQAEAAMKRQKEFEGKGVKDPERLKREKRKREAIEKEASNFAPPNQTGLKWTVT